jgi:hypothetical protein
MYGKLFDGMHAETPAYANNISKQIKLKVGLATITKRVLMFGYSKRVLSQGLVKLFFKRFPALKEA